MSDVSQKARRVVEAPGSKMLPNRVLSVVLAEEEDVEWIWTNSLAGSYVSGYSIVKKVESRKRTAKYPGPTGQRRPVP